MSNSLSQRVEDTLRYEFSGWIAQHPNAALWRVITGKVLADVRDALLSDQALDAAGYSLGGEHAHAGDRRIGEAMIRDVLRALGVASSEERQP